MIGGISQREISLMTELALQWSSAELTDSSLEVVNCYNKEDEILAPKEIFRLILKKLKERNIL